MALGLEPSCRNSVFLLNPLGVGHGHGAQHGVCPVDVAVDPVHSQPIGGLQVAADDGVVGGEAVRPVDLCAVDLALGQVRPVDAVAGHLRVQGHHVLEVGDEACVLATVQGHLAHLVPVGEEEVGDGVHGLAGLAVGVQLEAGPALALVAARQVHTQLAADVGVLTLIDIFAASLVHQPVAFGTMTLVADSEVEAGVGAASVAPHALIGRALFDGLV